MFFLWYCLELKDAGFIDAINLAPHSLVLSDPVYLQYLNKGVRKSVEKQKTLLQGHSYTPDFEIVWDQKCPQFIAGTPEVFAKNAATFYQNNNYSCVEVKPVFDHQAMQRQFSINQKWVYSKHGIFVQKIIPQVLFEKTFTPKKVINDPDMIYKKGDKAGKTKIKWKIKTLKEFINEN